MARRAWSPCSTPGCPEVTPPGTSRCDHHRREAEQRRGTARQRGYDRAHESRFRPGVLARQPWCVCTDCDDHATPCSKRSTDADHWPLDRRELVARGMDPNDPAHGRGLCSLCHKRATAKHQQGGWNAR